MKGICFSTGLVDARRYADDRPVDSSSPTGRDKQGPGSGWVSVLHLQSKHKSFINLSM